MKNWKKTVVWIVVIAAIGCALLTAFLLTDKKENPEDDALQIQEEESGNLTSDPVDAQEVVMPSLLECSEAELEEAEFILTDWMERSKPAYDIVIGGISLEEDSDGRVIPLTLKGHNGRYFKVIDPRYSSINDLKKVINSVCTESGAKCMRIYGWEPLYIEEDGQLYRSEADLPVGFDPGWSAEIVGIVKKSHDTLVLRVPCDLEYSESEGEFSDLTFIKKNDTWLFSNQQVY